MTSESGPDALSQQLLPGPPQVEPDRGGNSRTDEHFTSSASLGHLQDGGDRASVDSTKRHHGTSKNQTALNIIAVICYPFGVPYGARDGDHFYGPCSTTLDSPFQKRAHNSTPAHRLNQFQPQHQRWPRRAGLREWHFWFSLPSRRTRQRG